MATAPNRVIVVIGVKVIEVEERTLDRTEMTWANSLRVVDLADVTAFDANALVADAVKFAPTDPDLPR